MAKADCAAKGRNESPQQKGRPSGTIRQEPSNFMQTQLRTNQDKVIAVIRALAREPQRSNVAIATSCGVSEFVVRRYRVILEQASILSISTVREGIDGKDYSLPTTPAPEAVTR